MDINDDIKELKSDVKEVRHDIQTLLVQVEGLKIKSGIWGVMGGAFPIAIGLGVWAVRALAN